MVMFVVFAAAMMLAVTVLLVFVLFVLFVLFVVLLVLLVLLVVVGIRRAGAIAHRASVNSKGHVSDFFLLLLSVAQNARAASCGHPRCSGLYRAVLL